MKKIIIGICILFASFLLIDFNFWLGTITMGVGAIIARAGRVEHMRKILEEIDQSARRKKTKQPFK